MFLIFLWRKRWKGIKKRRIVKASEEFKALSKKNIRFINYQLRVKGLNTPHGTISVRTLTELFSQITTCAERSLRLAIEGQSVKPGPPPAWIETSTDLTFTGLESGSTVLNFEAPILGDTIADLLGQQDLWISPPKPDDTAFSIISKSVRDTTAENLESDYYDAGVLNSLLALKQFLGPKKHVIELHSPQRTKEDFVLSMSVIEKVERLKVKTPEPQAFIVSGQLDQIGHSKKKFELVLKDGQHIPGRIEEEFMLVEDLRKLWGSKVSVKGMVYFKPSGKIRLLEAHVLKPMEAGEEIFEKVPVQTSADFMRLLPGTPDRRDWLKDVWGKWPGDESIEDLLGDLRR